MLQNTSNQLWSISRSSIYISSGATPNRKYFFHPFQSHWFTDETRGCFTDYHRFMVRIYTEWALKKCWNSFVTYWVSGILKLLKDISLALECIMLEKRPMLKETWWKCWGVCWFGNRKIRNFCWRAFRELPKKVSVFFQNDTVSSIHTNIEQCTLNKSLMLDLTF